MAQHHKKLLTGLEKAAILMNVLGAEKSFELMKNIRDSDLRRLLNVMGHTKKASVALVNSVLQEFLLKLSEKEEILFDENLTHLETMTKGLGAERARNLLGSLNEIKHSRKHLSVVEDIDPAVLCSYLADEHPQTIALVLAHLDLERQVIVIRSLPELLRTEVILRMAHLEQVGSDRLEELQEVLGKELAALEDTYRNPLGGIVSVAEILNRLDSKMMNSVLTRIEDKDPLLGNRLRHHLFTFSDIFKLEHRELQLVVRELPSERLVLALKSATKEIREKIFSAMSARAAETLKEDLESLGPQKVIDVEAAQREVVAVVRRLEGEGKIAIGVAEEADIIP